ncbi:oligosaccharide flippase family protein [Cytobacillus firmus]|uniref:oligosaccharide flippase family protein n=1 Tax=Cytobacillus firmus TaxID=1399 RepID=UPI002161AA50|nr:oligosaccharide flippase family protein [Cytobacillus firmus]MCS0654819.1 oligosaccharide flippase family protein [Cytobacillus firmus]
MSTIKARAINSLKWTTLFSVYITISNSLGLIIKSRFLSPEQFGGLSILMLFIGFFQVFSDMGISQAIIKKERVVDEEISTLFYFNIIISAIFGAILFFSAHILATIFNYEIITELLQLASMIILIKGPSILLKAILEKELLFKTIVVVDIISDLVLQISTLVFLINGLGLLSIVYAYILANIVSTVIYICFVLIKLKVKITLTIKPKLLSPFMKFGIYVTGQSVLSYVSSRIDIIIIGMILSPEILGIYFFGKNLLEKIHQLITTSFKKVLFPTFSKLASNQGLLTQTYYKLCKYISLVAFPVFTGAALTAHLFVPLIFGEQWKSSVVVVQVFSVFLILKLITDKLTISLLYAKDKPNYVFFTNLFTTSVYIFSLFLFSKYELLGVIISYSLFTLYRSLIFEHLANKILQGSFSHLISIFREAFIGTLIMTTFAAGFYFVSKNIENQIFLLSGVIIISVISYFLSVKILAKETIEALISVVKKRIIPQR